DGTLLGEGIGIICLKRLSDAITDGDRIYAAIRSVASSSDGYGGSVLAPSLDGEALAMQRAYDEAGISPATVELLEAHGTATPAGDLVELQAIQKVFDPDGARRSPWCALGSVKSMIGHCQSASAVAGVIKAALSLYHKILPPTLNVSQPSKRIEWSTHPCYVLSQARPWIASPERGYHRRAAVSAFGFGGINAHAVLEEHPCGDHLVNLIQRSSTERAAIKASTHETRDANKNSADGRVQQWTSEVLAFSAVNTEELIRTLQVIDTFIIESPRAALKDIAYTVRSNRSSTQATGGANSPYDQVRLAII